MADHIDFTTDLSNVSLNFKSMNEAIASLNDINLDGVKSKFKEFYDVYQSLFKNLDPSDIVKMNDMYKQLITSFVNSGNAFSSFNDLLKNPKGVESFIQLLQQFNAMLDTTKSKLDSVANSKLNKQVNDDTELNNFLDSMLSEVKDSGIVPILKTRRRTKSTKNTSKSNETETSTAPTVTPKPVVSNYEKYNHIDTNKFNDTEWVPIDVAMRYLDASKSGGVEKTRKYIPSMMKSGFTTPLVMAYNQPDNTGLIAKGNTRLNIAQAMGLSHVPIMIAPTNSLPNGVKLDKEYTGDKFQAKPSDLLDFNKSISQTDASVKQLNKDVDEVKTTAEKVQIKVDDTDVKQATKDVNQLKQSKQANTSSKGSNNDSPAITNDSSIQQTITNAKELADKTAATVQELQKEVNSTPVKNEVTTANNTVKEPENKQENDTNTEVESINNAKSAVDQMADSVANKNKLLSEEVSILQSESPVVDTVKNKYSELFQLVSNIKGITTSSQDLTPLTAESSQLNDVIKEVTNNVNLVGNGLNSLSGVTTNITDIVESFNQLQKVMKQVTKLSGNTDTDSINKLNIYLGELSQLLEVIPQQFGAVTSATQSMKGMLDTISASSTALKKFQDLLSNSDSLKVEQVDNLVVYFRSLIDAMNAVGEEFDRLSVDGQKLESVGTAIKDVNDLMLQFDRITLQSGKDVDLAPLKDYFEQLNRFISDLVGSFKLLQEESGTSITSLIELLTQLNQAYANVNASQQDTVEGAEKSTEAQKTLGESLQNMNTASKSASNSMSGMFRSASQGGDTFLSKLMSLRMRFDDLRFGITSLATAFGGKELYNWLIGTNAQVEQLEKSLQVVLKSIDAATTAIQQLRSYAALTPFQEMETFQAGETLAANQMDIQRWVKVAGDLASAKQFAGVQLNDVINVLTRINSGDFGKAMIRLRQMGISLSDLKAQGLEFSKNNTFLGSTTQMLDAIESIVEKRYGGLTNTLGQTVSGSLSTIKDFIQQIGIELGGGAFKDFESWLQRVKRDLQDFRDSTTFQSMITGFNEARKILGSLGTILEPFVNIITGALKIVAQELPAIAQLLRMYIIDKIATGLVGGLAKVLSNWTLIHSQAQAEVAVLESQGFEVGKIRTTLAEIVALKKLGLQLSNEQNAADATAGALLKTTTGMKNSKGQTVVESINSTAATAATTKATSDAARSADKATESAAAAQKAEQAAETAEKTAQAAKTAEATADATAAGAAGAASTAGQVAAGAAMSSVAGSALSKAAGGMTELMGTAAKFLGWVGIIITAITTIVGLIKSVNSAMHTSLDTTNRSADDYKRLANNQIEEVRTLENLSDARTYAEDKIKRYTVAQDQLNSSTQKNTDATKANGSAQSSSSVDMSKVSAQEVQQAVTTNELTDAKNSLLQADTQIMQIDPKMATALVDSTGKLKDETGAFNDSTKAIQDNILQRKIEIDLLQKQKMQAAQFDSDKAKNDIQNNNNVINAVNGQYSWMGNTGARIGGGIANAILGIFGTNFGQAVGWIDQNILGNKNTSASIAEKAWNIMGMSPNDRNIALGELTQTNMEDQNIIGQVDVAKQEAQQAKDMGFFLKKANYSGNNFTGWSDVLDKNGEKTIDWDAYYAYLDKQKEKTKSLMKGVEGISQRVQDIMDATTQDSKDVTTKYDIQLENLRGKLGGDTSKSSYLELENKKDSAVMDYWDSVMSDIDKVSEQNTAFEKAIMDMLPPALKELLNAGISFDEVSQALEDLGKNSQATLTGKIANYRRTLLDLQKYLDASSLSINSFTSDADKLEVAKENEKVIERNKEQAELQKVTAQADIAQRKREEEHNLLSDITEKWDALKSQQESRRDLQLGQKILNGEDIDFTDYIATYRKANLAVRSIILQEISALKKVLPKLHDDKDIRSAKTEILSLEKEAQNILVENQQQDEQILSGFNSRWDNIKNQLETKRDIQLINDQLQNQSTDSAKYKADMKRSNLALRDMILKEIDQLKNVVLPQMHSDKNKLSVQLELLTLQKDANQLLLDIKNNTSTMGEFNKPSFVKALTYYDYMRQAANVRTISIGDAHIAFNIDAPQSLEDVDNIMKLIQEYLGNNVTRNNSSGIANPTIY